MEPKSVCAIFLREGKDGKEVLAISRKGKLDDLNLIGGTIEAGETPEAAMAREVLEEVGVTVTDSAYCYERVAAPDDCAWCYEVKAFEGEPRAMEPKTRIAWVPILRLLEEGCTFREYNRGLFLHLGLISPEDELPGDWEGFKPALEVPRMPEEDLKKFVLEFLGGHIFTDKHISPNASPDMVGMIFMPIAMGAFSECSRDSLKQIGCIWEYNSQALPRSINGYPCFMSLHIMHVDDWTRCATAIQNEEERQKNLVV